MLLLALSNSARAINPAYPDLTYWEQWALDNAYTISNYVYSEGSTTGQDGEIGNEFICIKDDVNQVIIGRPDVCGTYYNGLGYSFADITTDPTNLTQAPDIIDSVTDNLLDQNLANWGGCNYTGNDYLGGTNPGGPMPNCGQNLINWSYGGYWVYRRHAIEQALKQAGVNVDGYTWQFRIKNLNGDRPDQAGTDALDIRMIIWDKSGNQVHHKQWYYDTKFDWTTFSGTELFANPLIGENLRDWQLQMYGRDTGFWSGYYGPEIDMGNSEINMIYSSNPCAIDPLMHPDCEGYVDAYANYLYDQNCQANPLYDSGCPGYAQAYFDQQCNANPLSNQSCPGYAAAYFNNQCSINPLYDSACPGYAEALYAYECSADPLFDSGCPGYETAYLEYQCSLDPLYDQTCDGYASAYYDQQCSINPLYDSGCPGYETAYYDYQCSLDALYDTGCNGYDDAFYSFQCSLDALYDTQCPGYAEAYYLYQCGLDPLYDRNCDGYAEAYAQENILNEETASTPETISSTSTETVPVTDPEEIGKPSATGDSTVDGILDDLSASPTVAVVVAEPVADVAPEPNQEESTQEEQMEEELASLEVELDQAETESDESSSESDGDNSESSDESEGETSDGGDSESEKKDSKKEKMKKAIAKRAASLAERMSAAATLEAQQAAQAQVLALINYVPDFNTYQRQLNGGYLPDAAGYPDTQVPESRRGLRNGLAQQLLHEKMVEMQYENSSDR